MARVGGRNAAVAWVVGLGCAATVAALAMLALPMLPASFAWVGTTVGDSLAGSQGSEGDAVVIGDNAPADGALPAECRELYVDALWAALVWAPDAVLSPSTDAPATSATGLVDALAPAVRLTCAWTSADGTISTTLADVPTDAGAIAAAALPAAGFECAETRDRIRCTRSDGDLLETIEAGSGLWLSTSQSAWHPEQYAQRVADRVWS